MSVDQYTEVAQPIVYTIAQSVVKRYSMIERNDVVQEIWAWFFSHPRQVKRFMEDEDDRKGERQLARAMKNAAERYCREEKARMAGYHTSDEYFYDPGTLRLLLPMVWQDPRNLAFGSASNDGTPRRNSAPNEGNNLQALVADVKQGLDKIPARHRVVIELTYRDGLEYDEVAATLSADEGTGVTKHAAEMRLQRALELLVERLGGERPFHDGPGARHVMSNAQAQALTRNGYDSDE